MDANVCDLCSISDYAKPVHINSKTYAKPMTEIESSIIGQECCTHTKDRMQFSLKRQNDSAKHRLFQNSFLENGC